MSDVLLILARQSAEIDVDRTLPGTLALGAGVLVLVALRILDELRGIRNLEPCQVPTSPCRIH